MAKIYIPYGYEKAIETCPFLFLKKCVYKDYQNELVYYWKVEDDNINDTFKEEEFGDEYKDSEVLLGKVVKITNNVNSRETTNNKSDIYQISVVNQPEESDLDIMLNYAIGGELNILNEKFNYCYLMWCLNYGDISSNLLRASINKHPKKEKLLSILREISPCLSIQKQNLLISLLGSGKIYNPTCVTEALFRINPQQKNFDNLTIFDKFDIIFRFIKYQNIEFDILKELDRDNEIIEIYNWLENDEYKISNYNIVTKCYSFMSHYIRLYIVKRYFHDIRNKYIEYDENIIEQFENNKYNKFQIFRHCLKSPKEAYPLSIELLCNSVRIFKKSNGRKFQDINGLLDIAIKKCDVVQPKIDFKVNEILPICNGGAIVNASFSGFIKIEKEYVLKPETIEKENIKKHARNLIDRFTSRYEEYFCSYAINGDIQLAKCLNLFKGEANCLKKHVYDDRWNMVNNNAKDLCRLFIDDIDGDNIKYFEEKQVNYEKLINIIRSLPQKYGIKNKSGYSFIDINESRQELLNEFYELKCYKIYPNKDAVLVSKQYNINKIQYINSLNISLDKENLLEQKKWMSDITLKTLKEELKTEPICGTYFEVGPDKLDYLSKIYYYNASSNDNDFFTCRNNSKFYNLCAPKYAGTIHKATELNYFWCRGKECFKNNLDYQNIEKCYDYKDYTLLHIAEILGYKLITTKPGGYESMVIVRNYIAQIMKSVKKFNRLKCRECGHLLFIYKEGSYNQHTKYECINSLCSEYRKEVYLNYCYKCKKGLIDSRDTAQCDNHWYVCPSCLSCCDDNLIERLIQRDLLYKKSSKWLAMRGKGHNDKNMYFCPSCGTLLTNNGDIYYCDTCNKKWVKNNETMDI